MIYLSLELTLSTQAGSINFLQSFFGRLTKIGFRKTTNDMPLVAL
jgi:hypothetical protein